MDQYFYIFFMELNTRPLEDDFCIPLHGSGYLCIGSSEWTNAITISDNTFFSIDEAVEAMKGVKKALQFKAENWSKARKGSAARSPAPVVSEKPRFSPENYFRELLGNEQ